MRTTPRLQSLVYDEIPSHITSKVERGSDPRRLGKYHIMLPSRYVAAEQQVNVRIDEHLLLAQFTERVPSVLPL